VRHSSCRAQSRDPASAKIAGLGIPSLLARLKRHPGSVERAMGVSVALTGVAFLTGSMSSISIWLLETFPALQNFG
jgi:hypothetical protein